jgi:aspartate racemase
LLDAARRLGAWVDFLVITSNGPHLIQDEIERAAGRKVLSMIEITLEEVQQRGWRNVGVLGFGNPMIYTSRLRSMSIRHETLDPDLRARLDTEIMKVMEGRDGAASSATAREAVDALRLKKVDGIVLGCTEIPLLLSEQVTGPDLMDPAELLAEAAVKRALAQGR